MNNDNNPVVDDDPLYMVEARSDGTYVGIMSYMFTTAIVTGEIGDRISFIDRWCYHDALTAIIRLGEWKTLGYEGEPQGWHRHPASGRRRKDGDPNQEEVWW